MSVPNVQPVARSTLVSLVEGHLTTLIRESVQVQRHCKRARLHTTGNNGGANNSNQLDDDDGSGEQQGIIRRRLHADDINMALQWRGSEKIYATGIVGDHSRDDKSVNLKAYLKSEMEVRPPTEVGLSTHWLAVDGVQPEIPQNPPRRRTTKQVHRVELDDEQTTGGVNTKNVEPDTAPVSSSSDGVHVTQLLPKLLSEELQLYFTRITTAVERGGATPSNRQAQDAALSSVAKDAGIQELVPFLVHYVSKSLYEHIGHTDHCRTLVRMGQSLLKNHHLHLELHLHQMLPALLTCVVAESLASQPWQNHWVLRKEAAEALVNACNVFGDDYATLKSRVLRTLCDAIGPDKCLATQYGGFVAISFFGPKAINAFLLPLAVDYWEAWQGKLQETSDLEHQHELQMCQQAVLDALGIFMYQDNGTTPENLRMSWDELERTFGDQLVMMSSEKPEVTLYSI